VSLDIVSAKFLQAWSAKFGIALETLQWLGFLVDILGALRYN
jgi:hypothetical protein